MIDTQEREAVIGALRASEARLLDLLRELAPAHQRFREAPERWSIAEIVEHLVLFEEFIRGAVERALQGQAATEEQRAEVRTKEPLVIGLAQARAEQSLLRVRQRLRQGYGWTSARWLRICGESGR
jgi:uncharacterized damage-inducible protein DinB